MYRGVEDGSKAGAVPGPDGMAGDGASSAGVMPLSDLPPGAIEAVFARAGLEVAWVADGARIPATHWGEPEAGLLGGRLFVAPSTPVHSALHEGCHWICMDDSRRSTLDTDAGGDHDEENAVNYLSILLSDELAPAFGRDRMMRDMDRWGYSFRLGSARAWFESDAEDACSWLRLCGLIDAADRPTWRIRV